MLYPLSYGGGDLSETVSESPAWWPGYSNCLATGVAATREGYATAASVAADVWWSAAVCAPGLSDVRWVAADWPP